MDVDLSWPNASVDSEPFAQEFPETTSFEELEEQQAKERSDDMLSSMDIFTQETASDNDGFNLADELDDVDLDQLLAECKDVAASLKRRKSK